MTNDEFDLALFGVWGDDGYCGMERDAPLSPAVVKMADRALLEIKAMDMAAETPDLREVLNDVTRELKAQAVVFSKLREQACAALNDPDADQKLARADLKAANDALSLIVRTLDKTDEMQRRINDDRAAEAERNLDDTRLGELKDKLDRLISDRAREYAGGDKAAARKSFAGDAPG